MFSMHLRLLYSIFLMNKKRRVEYNNIYEKYCHNIKKIIKNNLKTASIT